MTCVRKRHRPFLPPSPPSVTKPRVPLTEPRTGGGDRTVRSVVRLILTSWVSCFNVRGTESGRGSPDHPFRPSCLSGKRNPNHLQPISTRPVTGSLLCLLPNRTQRPSDRRIRPVLGSLHSSSGVKDEPGPGTSRTRPDWDGHFLHNCLTTPPSRGLPPWRPGRTTLH